MRFTIPTSIKEEHDELHAELVTATKSGGRTAAAANAVAALMHPHFVKEEEFALPPLGALADLVKGAKVEALRDVLAMTDKLKLELAQMLEEHQAIVAALKALTIAATDESKPEIADFARRLIHHAMIEEQVMYPAAILVGEHVRQGLGSSGR
jgi:hemerythrin HHE cation binding domain-containing protein